MARAKIVADADGNFYGIRFNCPGCNEAHVLHVNWLPDGKTESPHVANSPHWGFNGNFDRPTFQPSIHIRSGHHAPHHKQGDMCWCTYNDQHADAKAPFVCLICHSYVTDGRIQFLGDSTHALSGQTVDLPELETEECV